MIELQVPRDVRPNARERKDAMCKIRVHSRVDNLVIPGGYMVPAGESVMQIYAPDLPIVEAMVEREPEAIEQARVFFERDFLKTIEEQLKDISDPDAKKAHTAKARQEHCGSLEGTFYFLHKRDIAPLVSVEVLEKNITPPVREQEVEQTTHIAGLVAAEVAKALAAALPAVVAQLMSAATNANANAQQQTLPQQNKQR